MSNKPLSAHEGKPLRRGHNPTKVIVASFLVVIICGALLLSLPCANKGPRLSLPDAFFTATSATCVTGLIVADTYTQFTVFGQAVILLLIQIGGLGLVTLTSFFNVMIGRHMGFKSMQLAGESISLSDATQSKSLLWFIIKVALLFEGAGAALLAPVFIGQYGAGGIFTAIFISVSAFCNAGFDLMGRVTPFASVMGYAQNPYVLSVISLLIISGGLGFLVWQDMAMYRRSRHLRMHTKLVLAATVGLLVLGTVLIGALEWSNPATLGGLAAGDKIMNAFFQSVSTRTAGFASIDLAACNSMTKLVMILLMFVGAAPGGTGGGIKVTTVAVILVAVACIARGQDEASLMGRHIKHQTVYKALTILCLALAVMLTCAVTMYFNCAAEVKEIDCAFEGMSAFATVGLGVGITGQMNLIAKIVTMLTMLIGRVGPVAMVITLTRRSGKSAQRKIQPEANIVVA